MSGGNQIARLFKRVMGLDNSNNDALRVISPDPIDVVVTDYDDNIEQDFAVGNISAVRAIYKVTNGVSYGDNNIGIAESEIIGITRNSALNGDKIKYKTHGKFYDSSLNFPINDYLYLGSNGLITNIPPVTGFRTRIGTSGGLGVMNILIEEPIIL